MENQLPPQANKNPQTNTTKNAASFSELNLSAPLLRAISELGFETPSPIQAETLPILLGDQTDFIGLAATGTGKTAAFAIPLLERVDAKKRQVQALVLCPTRELAIQVAGQIDLLGKYKGVRSVTIYGGSSYLHQISGLRSGAQVVVGTPGRLIDHLEQGNLKLEELQVLVLDEADEMFSMGFKEDIEVILKKTPRESCNIWLFSATMEREVRRVVDEYLRDPQQVAVNRKEMLSSTVEQFFYPTRETDKPEILCKLIEAADDFYGVVFCQTKSLVQDLTTYLMDRGYKVDSLHGDKDQNSRERTMQAFRDRKITILVCTDVAARGLDVKDITHVVNYSLPRELDNYVHRIGRTARSGKAGIAMNLVTLSHRNLMYRIEQMTKTRMKEGVIPSRREIATKKIGKILDPFRSQPFSARALEVMNDEWKSLLETMTAEQVAAHFITMMMPELFVDKERPKRDVRREDTGARSHTSGRAGPRSTTASLSGSPRARIGGSLPPKKSERSQTHEYDNFDQDVTQQTSDNSTEQRRPFREHAEGQFNRKRAKAEKFGDHFGSNRDESLRSPHSSDAKKARSPRVRDEMSRESLHRDDHGHRGHREQVARAGEQNNPSSKQKNYLSKQQRHNDDHTESPSKTAGRAKKASSPVSRKIAAANASATKKDRWPANDSLIAPNRRARRAAMFGNSPPK